MTKIRDLHILEEMHEGYYEVDLMGNFTLVNDVICEMAQMSRQELIGLNFKEYAAPHTAQRIFAAFNKVFRTGLPQHIEYELLRRDGSSFFVELSVFNLKDEHGRTVGFNGIATDVTSRKLLEENLRKSMQSFESLFENANELIITTDMDGYITRLNKQVEDISEYTKEELIGKSILTIAHPEDRKLYIDFWHELIAGQSPRHELRAMSRTGKVGYLLASGSVIREGGEIIEIQYNAQLISDLKQAQMTILELKNHLKSIIESSPNMIVCLDRDGIVEIVNPVTERILHIPMHALIGNRLGDVCPGMRAFASHIARVMRERVPQSLLEETLPDGNTYNVTIYPLSIDAHDGVVFTAVDVTEKKRMEVELIQAQKMETIGLLAGGFAHDFNNILMGITGNLDLLRLARDDEKRVKYIQSMETITARARDLIAQMLMFSKKKVGTPQRFSLKKAMADVVDIATKSIPKHIRIECNPPEKDYSLCMDYTQLTQVMLNLIINARDAIGDRQDGLIQIGLQPIWVDEDTGRRFMLDRPGRFIKIDIMDNGCGIEREHLTRIFDPFFTTKPKDVGTGLGLAITYNIIKNAEGSIRVFSEKGTGTRFSIILPISEGVADMFVEAAEVAASTQRFRILLVDDEEMLREIGKEMLESLGHEVLTAGNGYECLAVLQQEGRTIDLVILDMIMPGLDGQHTLAEMLKTDLHTKVIVSSGFYREELMSDIMASSLVVARLNKPFNMDELSRTLALVG